MTNAHIKTTAGSGTGNGRFASLARRGVAACVLVCAGIGAAQAQYHGRRDDTQLPPPPSARTERLAVPPQIEAPREQRMFDQREQQREERRQAVQMMQQEGARDGARRGGRLTPDERRELRRQVNEAGMDIYPSRERR